VSSYLQVDKNVIIYYNGDEMDVKTNTTIITHAQLTYWMDGRHATKMTSFHNESPLTKSLNITQLQV